MTDKKHLKIIGIALMFCSGIGIVYLSGQKPQPAPPNVAKHEPQKREQKIPLEFLGGEGLERGPGYIRIQKGGHANFRFNLPEVKNGKYKIYCYGQRERGGQDFLEINRGKGNNGLPFAITHSPTDFPIEIVFFDDGYAVGMPGEPKYFRSGDNYFKLWADEGLRVQLDKPHYVKITYQE